MKKKVLIVLVALMLCCSTNIFAFGIGVQGGFSFPNLGSLDITFKLDSIPLIFTASAYMGNTFSLGITADYWFFNSQITGPLYWFVGVGAGASFAIGDIFGANIVARVPIGLNMYFLNNTIEPYIQVLPGIGVQVAPKVGVGFALDANIGIRFWIPAKTLQASKASS
ncbi:MAG: hypothetical protein ACRC4W_05595 [Treponemataceae bacterium]